MLIRQLAAILAFILLNGCALTGLKVHPVVTMADGTGFSYTGRGAGAGVALMSTMGPVGIAVGAAIDEGIRKDLEESAIAAGFDIVHIIQEQKFPVQEVLVTAYGMKDVPGSDNLMFPFIDMQLLNNGDQKSLELNYRSAEDMDHNPYNSLGEYRQDGNLIIEDFELLLNAVTE